MKRIVPVVLVLFIAGSSSAASHDTRPRPRLKLPSIIAKIFGKGPVALGDDPAPPKPGVNQCTTSPCPPPPTP